MRQLTDRVAVAEQAESAEVRIDLAVERACHRFLGFHAIADEIGDAADSQPVLAGKLLELRSARHRAVRIHDLAQHPGRLQRRQSAQVDGGFRVARARQHAAGLRAQREDVTGPGKVLFDRSRGGERANCRRAIVG